MNYLVFGENSRCLLGNKQNDIKKPIRPELFHDEVCLDFQTNNSFATILHQNGTVDIWRNDLIPTNYKTKSPIVQISSGHYGHLVLLTKDQRVYTYGDHNEHGQLGNGSLDPNTKELYEIVSLRDKNIKKVYGCQISAFALSGDKKNTLYWWGHHYTIENETTPKPIDSNVKTVYNGCSWHIFFKKNDDSFYGWGYNHYGQLGCGNKVTRNISVKVDLPVKSSTVVDVACTNHGSVIRTNENNIYIAGSIQSKNKLKFEKIDFFEDKEVISMSSGRKHVLFLTRDLDLLLIGHSPINNYFPSHTLCDSKNNIFALINLGEENQNIGSIYMDYNYGVLLKVKTSPLLQDLKRFYEEKQFCDSDIFGIPIHSLLLKIRLNNQMEFEEIKKAIEKNFTKEDTINFIQWVYYEDALSISLVEKIESMFNIKNLAEKSIMHDFQNLYNDDDSKNFTILVPYEDPDENVEDECEEIPVHKLLLQIQSGLFRDFFLNLKKNTVSVKDYSGKTVESLEIFVKFLYTGTIDITADDDPRLVYDELSDAMEYYQLSIYCSLTQELIKMKNNYNL
ncbi:hypothetical protein M0812_26902 [Anaeramoeba flamelloides]|uniref:BTB domain-containing protein n=1 Tax=Anaeramoeba flamelloides TaxID=1746091 RepID=A0AAV7YFM9_9EUKA|nr:hypothetical protein M0812_26902 [Anaeramoeba flamelloides]